MYQKDRLDDILRILKEHGYVTVKFLTDELHYSTATINRDLNVLQSQKLITRSYGGAQLAETTIAPLTFRYHKMKATKNQIGKKAASFIENGDTIFIDGSTTGQYIGRYITDRKDLTVITNNMNLASFLSDYGITCFILGGEVVEPPSMLGGMMAVENAKSYRVDKMFFSTYGMEDDGRIGSTRVYYDLHRVMMKNADKIFYMMDSGKLHVKTPLFLGDFGDVDYVITDCEFTPELKARFHSTRFIPVDAHE